jgi:hypothetical protein
MAMYDNSPTLKDVYDGWMTLVLTADPCQKISSYGEMYEVS